MIILNLFKKNKKKITHFNKNKNKSNNLNNNFISMGMFTKLRRGTSFTTLCNMYRLRKNRSNSNNSKNKMTF